ncbi:UDP-N-acetylmuramoyl-L-alanyl-D-glutamate--2,6-diaminopimelate ligase [Planctobacterium marinum]|uniref:UDP-N-acetylmuramyl-tripeptide synthetase n=1 Tax=Planctobacterium marinum TaxID=1631968 RepID=A0AA48HL78_9ALTE|nr:UDP-N-acetylmuramoyl-L-alanyl-D-glutamate--2,6-diaminopimelate ligase [Planctobacterium marinum]
MTPDMTLCNLKQMLQPFGIDAPELALDDLVLDSREVAIHRGFLAVAGHNLDGRDFIPQAVSLGAKVILAETDVEAEHGQMSMREHSLIIQFYRLNEQISALADVFFKHPTHALNTVAVTGTNGKTSTTHFLCQLSESMKQTAWFAGTLGYGTVNNLQTAKNTTPDPVSIQRLASQAVTANASDLMFEASSHALVQGRIRAVQTRVAIFTNLSRDHLDYHGTMEAYAEAKRRLMNQPGLETIVLNQSDAEHSNWLRFKPKHLKVILVGISELSSCPHPFCFADEIKLNASGTSFRLHSTWGEARISLPMYGEFNVLNVLSAIAAQIALGRDFNVVVKAAKQLVPVAGRAEFFRAPGKPDIVVDYAHTPDALHKILRSMRAHCNGKLICVFGCGGDRDQGKRPEMGSIASQYSDWVVLTNDNVRNENAQDIIADILRGIPQQEKVYIETDREEAIRWAVNQGEAGDLIVLAGKGHETSQIIGDTVTDYDERQFIKSLYKVAS